MHRRAGRKSLGATISGQSFTITEQSHEITASERNIRCLKNVTVHIGPRIDSCSRHILQDRKFEKSCEAPEFTPC